MKMKTCVGLAIVCLLLVRIEAHPPKKRILQGETVYDIMKYSAKADGTTDDAMVNILNFRPNII